MSIALITGSGGLVGSESAEYFAGLGMDVVGIDNDMRKVFFGAEASTSWNVERLKKNKWYRHYDVDVRDVDGTHAIFSRYGNRIVLVIHAAAQPSHDHAIRDPNMNDSINVSGTCHVLEGAKFYCPDAPFIFLSTNKVYGDDPNSLPLIERETRYELEAGHPYESGITEEMCTLPKDRFGASKFMGETVVRQASGQRTVCFRGGTLTGPLHSGTELHGFLAYLMHCTATGRPYTVFGYKGKQVRDALHSKDLVRAFHEWFKKPTSGEAYNIGGGRFSNCSVLEAITMCEKISGKKLAWTLDPKNRVGDHQWWISSCAKFQKDYPAWKPEYDVERILREIYDSNPLR